MGHLPASFPVSSGWWSLRIWQFTVTSGLFNQQPLGQIHKAKTMRLKPIFILIFLIATLNSRVSAQTTILDSKDLSQVKIDMVGDDQIRMVKDKAEELKMNNSDLVRLLKNKGLPDSEADKLKTRLESLKDIPEHSEPATTSSSATLENKSVTNQKFEERKDDLMQDQERDLSIFGSELFLKTSLVFEPNLRIPTPSSYILGPDDEVVVNVFGYSEKKYNLTVSEEGDIYIPNVGPLHVSGLSMDQATESIKRKLSATIYKAIRSGQTKVQVTLGKIRTIRVTVIGQAQKPGTYTVSSYTTLYNLLYLCGGPSDRGSYRSIELIRGNAVKKVADLYSFLSKGNQSDNLLLQEGDIVRIPYFGNRVSVSGLAKRIGKYEMLDTESLTQLLEYCGGFDVQAHKQSVTNVRVTDVGKKVADIQQQAFPLYKLQSGDSIIINKNLQRYVNSVTVKGFVSRPGIYEISDSLDILGLIEKAGGLMSEAYTEQVTIYRLLKNRQPAILSVNLDSIMEKGGKVMLRNEDQVMVNSILDFKDKQFVTVEGGVRKPLKFKWREDLSLKDVILAAGGITEKGDSGKIEIARRVESIGESAIETETIITSLHNNLSLKPYDYIIVRNKTGIVSTRSVIIVGEVKVPGKYILEKNNERITDLIKRAEGFRSSADSGIITIRRRSGSDLTEQEREKIFQRLLNIDADSLSTDLENDITMNKEMISIDLKEILSHPEISDNLVLEDGDIITINKSRNLVKISGEVYYPTIIPVNKKTSARYYIKQAGNFTVNARKSATVVVYPDGKAKKVKKFLFFRSYPKVTARSEIFIPGKQKDNRNKMGPGEWAVLISALGIISNVIISALK